MTITRLAGAHKYSSSTRLFFSPRALIVLNPLSLISNASQAIIIIELGDIHSTHNKRKTLSHTIEVSMNPDDQRIRGSDERGVEQELASARDDARHEKVERERVQQELDGVRSELSRVTLDRNATQTRLSDLQIDINGQLKTVEILSENLESSKQKVKHLKLDLFTAEQQLEEERKAHDKTRSRVEKLQEDVARQGVHSRDVRTAQDELRIEQTSHDASKQEIASLERQLADKVAEAAEDLRAQSALFATEKHTHAKARQEAEKRASKIHRQLTDDKAAAEMSETLAKKEREAAKNDVKVQREAADSFLKHLSTSLGSSVSPALEAGELTTLHASCKQPRDSADDKLRLPPIVIAAGHLPAAWSYVCLASAGVLMHSRFNNIIISSVSYELHWILDALDRVIKMAESTSVVPTDVLLVLLQGIAYVHLAMKTTTAELTPQPLTMLHSLMKHANTAGSVLKVVWTRVFCLVNHDDPVNTWVLNDERNTGKQINSSNSALPEGITLVYGLGYLFLTRSTMGQEQLFVIDKQAVQCVHPRMWCVYLQLPPVGGLEMRQLDLIAKDEHMEVADWLRDTGLFV